MIFKDRYHAGTVLVGLLEEYRDDPNAIVVALARGGVPTASVVARELHLPLDITCPRKIGAPGNPEFAIGAITETGEGIMDQNVVQLLSVSSHYLEVAIQRERQEASHRLKVYRKGMKERDLVGKTVILIDDGLATGSTMQAAIASVRSEGAALVVVAVPVSPPDTLKKIESVADRAYCLETPPHFAAVGQFYVDFGQTSDEEVIDLLVSSRRRTP